MAGAALDAQCDAQIDAGPSRIGGTAVGANFISRHADDFVDNPALLGRRCRTGGGGC